MNSNLQLRFSVIGAALIWAVAVLLHVIPLFVALTLSACGSDSDDDQGTPQIEEATVADLQADMEAGSLNSSDLVDWYLERIETLDRNGPTLRAVIEVNPDARSVAQALDLERSDQGPRGPLHGIPVLLKDNIDTGDQMLTTAGSLALVGAPASRDATVAERLRRGGAVLLGKTNLSEWANMRSLRALSGWSARGGQTLNPYALDHSPSGSSSGSAVAVAANLCAVAIGTETDGSVVLPAAANGVVGLKPTVGLTSRAGVIPLAHSQDTVGVLARTVADAAIVLGVIAGPDPRDPATQVSEGTPTDYTQFLDADGLRDARIGVPRQVFFGNTPESDAIVEAAIAALAPAGATIIDPADVPTAAILDNDASGFVVQLYEFKADLNSYLATRSGIGVATLADLIAFNTAHADTELVFFAQEIFDFANPLGSLETPAYLRALANSQRLSREEGIDAVMDQYQLDALVAPTGPPPWVIDYDAADPPLPYALSSVAARAGYPVITVPAGYVDGLPVGISFVGRAFSEPTLIRLAYAFEQATDARRPPQFLLHRPGAVVAQEGRNRYSTASPGINAGDESVCDNPPVSGLDQRGYVRPGTGHTQCSVGAYEANAFSPESCVGDCDGTGSATVDDLITIVNIALGTASMSACEAGDVNADGEVTVDEVITAVSVALSGCPTGPPFPWEPGPFGVGVRQLAFTKVSVTHPADERVLLTDVWYPAEPNAGPIDAVLGGVVDAPRAADTGNLPLVLFSHGSCGNPEQSRFLTTALASYGFVVAAPPHRGNVLSDFPSFDDCQSVAASTYAGLRAEREADIRFVIDSLLQLNVDPESDFTAAIDPNRIGVFGHSFGGETTQRVCALDARVRAGLVLAMGPAVPGRTIHVPIMVQGGDRDGFVPFGTVQLLFQGLPAPKYLVEIFHTGHTAFIDDCLVFFPACDGAGPDALTQDEAHQLVLRYAVPFLLHHVAGDDRFDTYFGPAPGVAFTADTGVD